MKKSRPGEETIREPRSFPLPPMPVEDRGAPSLEDALLSATITQRPPCVKTPLGEELVVGTELEDTTDRFNRQELAGLQARCR